MYVARDLRVVRVQMVTDLMRLNDRGEILRVGNKFERTQDGPLWNATVDHKWYRGLWSNLDPRGVVLVFKRCCTCIQEVLYLYPRGVLYLYPRGVVLVSKRYCTCIQEVLYLYSRGVVLVFNRCCTCIQEVLYLYPRGVVLVSKRCCTWSKRCCTCIQEVRYLYPRDQVYSWCLLLRRVCANHRVTYLNSTSATCWSQSTRLPGRLAQSRVVYDTHRPSDSTVTHTHTNTNTNTHTHTYTYAYIRNTHKLKQTDTIP